jgi:hypothetical protein
MQEPRKGEDAATRTSSPRTHPGFTAVVAAMGFVAVGAFAVGRLSIRRVVIRNAVLKSVEIEKLDVKCLRADEAVVSKSIELPDRSQCN